MLEAKIIIDVISNEDGTYDTYIATESSSGSHYDAIDAEIIGSYTADLIDSLEKEESGKSYLKSDDKENGSDNIEQYLDIIEKKGKEIRKKKEQAESAFVWEMDEAFERVKVLFPRVDALLVLANKCIEEGIELPKCDKCFLMGYGNGRYGFESDVICSNLGFVPRNARNSNELAYDYIGIRNGGYEDKYDILINGNEVFFSEKGKEIPFSDYDDKKNMQTKIRFLNHFFEKFDSFETAFYKWIKSLG